MDSQINLSEMRFAGVSRSIIGWTKYCSWVLSFSKACSISMLRSPNSIISSHFNKFSSVLQLSSFSGGNRELYHLFVGNLPFSFTIKELEDLAKDRGVQNFVDARITTDKRTGKSRGFGFLDFEQSSDLKLALKRLDGVSVEGRELKIDITEGVDSPNRGRRKATTSKEFSAFFGNLPYSIVNSDLEALVKEKIGDDKPAKARLVIANGRYLGYGHVDFGSENDRDAAIEALNGVEILGRVINVEIAKGSKGSQESSQGQGQQQMEEDAYDDQLQQQSSFARTTSINDPRRTGLDALSRSRGSSAGRTRSNGPQYQDRQPQANRFEREERAFEEDRNRKAPRGSGGEDRRIRKQNY